MYVSSNFVTGGGLVSYGPDFTRPVAPHSKLRRSHPQGEKPADLPAQAPTRYQLVLNMRTAKGLGIEVPRTLLARADEAIE